MEFPVRLILAASNAAHRINDGFVKKYDDSKKESNSALLYKHFFQGHDLKVEDQKAYQSEIAFILPHFNGIKSDGNTLFLFGETGLLA